MAVPGGYLHGLPSDLPLEQPSSLIAQVVDSVTAMVDAEFAGVMLYVPEDDALVLQAPGYRLAPELLPLFRIPISEGGNAVRVFITGEIAVSHDTERDSRFIQHLVRLAKARSCITVPLSSGGRRIGVLNVCNKRRGSFTKADARVLSLVGSLLGTLVDNACLLQQVQRQHQVLRRVATVHDEITRSVLLGEGFDGITRRLAEVLGNPVVAQDAALEVLARHPQGDPQPWQVGSTPPPEGLRRMVRLPPVGTGLPSRVVAPVVYDREVVGFVTVVEKHRRLDEADMAALSHAAAVYGLELVRQRHALELEFRARAALLEEVMAARPADAVALRARALRLGLDLARPHALLLCEWLRTQPDPGGDGGDELLQRVAERFGLAVKRRHPSGLVTLRGQTVVVLASVAPDDAGAGAAVGRDLLSLVQPDAAGRLCVAVGGLGREPADYPVLFRQARDLLHLMRRLGRVGVVSEFEQLGPVGLIYSAANHDRLTAFVAQRLGRLEGYDARHGSNLVATLRAYLKCEGNLQAAAAGLYIHANTLRYRLRRIEKIAEVDLSDPDQRFDLRLALMVRDVLAGGTL